MIVEWNGVHWIFRENRYLIPFIFVLLWFSVVFDAKFCSFVTCSIGVEFCYLVHGALAIQTNLAKATIFLLKCPTNANICMCALFWCIWNEQFCLIDVSVQDGGLKTPYLNRFLSNIDTEIPFFVCWMNTKCIQIDTHHFYLIIQRKKKRNKF